jgi:hypothetical protein
MPRLRIVCGIVYKEMFPTNYNRFRLLFEEATGESLLNGEVVNRSLSATTVQLLRHPSGYFSKYLLTL